MASLSSFGDRLKSLPFVVAVNQIRTGLKIAINVYTESLGVFTPLGHTVTAAVTVVMLLLAFVVFVGRKYIKFSLFVFGFCVGAFLLVGQQKLHQNSQPKLY